MIETIATLAPGRYPPAGDLARHFLEGKPELFPALYPHSAGGPEGLARAAGARSRALADGEPAAPRDELARVLTEQNRGFGSGEETAEAIARLSRPGTMAVVTGQQAGFLGGPLFTLYKALGAIAAARRLTADGIEAVPVFWIASDDHDFREVAPFTLTVGEGGLLETIRLSGNDDEDGMPVGSRHPGTGWEETAARVLALAGDTTLPMAPFLAAYDNSRGMAHSFGRVMAGLFSRFGLVFADPSDRALKRLAAPLLPRFIERLDPLEAALHERENTLEAMGYPLQVPPRDGRTGLFIVDDQGRRRALLRERPGALDRFVLGGAGGEGLDRARLEALAAEEPWRFSGSALTRCLFQDYLFPTAAYVGGPGEVAYLAQSAALYPVLEMSIPAVVHRPSFTLFDRGALRFLQRHDFEPETGLTRPDELHAALLRKAAGPELNGALEKARHGMGLLLDELEDAITPLDPSLSGAVGRVRGGGFKGLDKVEKKVRSALRNREQTTFKTLERTLNGICPNGKPQERAHSGLPWICRHGSELLDGLLAATEPCSGAHRLMALR